MKSYIRAVLGREKGFTLVELLIVIAIIAILTIAFLPGALKAPAKARDAQRIKAVNDTAAALESYAAEKSGALPATPASGCLDETDGAAGISTLATNFANSVFPVDPKPVIAGDGKSACDDAAKTTRYLYRNLGGNYVVGAVLEVAAGSNTSVGSSTLRGYTTAGNFATLKPLVLPSGGGSGPATITTTGLYLRIGP